MNGADREPVRFRRTTVALGTFLTVEGVLPHGRRADPTGTERDAYRAFERAWQVFNTVGAVMHPTVPGSDLERIARTRPGDVVHVHAWTAEVLRLSWRLSQSTGGLFDPCLPDQPGRLGDLDLTGEDTVLRRGPPVALDLGGIAKGFAIDRAIEVLQSAGCTEGLVNAGGDVRAFGGGAHTVLIRTHGNITAQIALENEALAVSEPRSAASPQEHRGFYSPLTGQEITGRTVAVRAGTAAIADALTKCAMLCPEGTLAALLREYEATLIELPAVPSAAGSGEAPRR